MRLGLPLVSVLEPQERVALIAHEIAHDVNGDPARGTQVAVRSGLSYCSSTRDALAIPREMR